MQFANKQQQQQREKKNAEEECQKDAIAIRGKQTNPQTMKNYRMLRAKQKKAILLFLLAVR